MIRELRCDVVQKKKTFVAGRMCNFVNITSLSLIPKVHYSFKVGEFTLICYCTILYKIISKILTKRSQEVVGSVVSQAEADFIPNRL